MATALFALYCMVCMITTVFAAYYIALWILAIATIGWIACVGGIILHYVLPLTYCVYTTAYAVLLLSFAAGLACGIDKTNSTVIAKLCGVVFVWGVVVAAVTETLL